MVRPQSKNFPDPKAKPLLQQCATKNQTELSPATGDSRIARTFPSSCALLQIHLEKYLSLPFEMTGIVIPSKARNLSPSMFSFSMGQRKLMNRPLKITLKTVTPECFDRGSIRIPPGFRQKHAGMTTPRGDSLFPFSVGERKLLNHFVVKTEIVPCPKLLPDACCLLLLPSAFDKPLASVATSFIRQRRRKPWTKISFPPRRTSAA